VLKGIYDGLIEKGGKKMVKGELRMGRKQKVGRMGPFRLVDAKTGCGASRKGPVLKRKKKRPGRGRRRDPVDEKIAEVLFYRGFAQRKKKIVAEVLTRRGLNKKKNFPMRKETPCIRTKGNQGQH